MFLQAKKEDDTGYKEVIEIIHSGVGFSLVVEHNSTTDVIKGRIIKLSKKQFKKGFKKLKKHNYTPIDSEFKKELIEAFELDKIGLIHYTEDYIENNKKDEIKKQTEADINRNRKILADDYDYE